MNTISKDKDYAVKGAHLNWVELALVTGVVTCQQNDPDTPCVLVYEPGHIGLHVIPLSTLYRFSDRTRAYVKVRRREIKP